MFASQKMLNMLKLPNYNDVNDIGENAVSEWPWKAPLHDGSDD